jgi:hypothetical protein
MGKTLTKRLHSDRAREERALAEQATHPAARQAHAKLAQFHSWRSRRPDFVILEKASRAGQSDSYWAAVNLNGTSAGVAPGDAPQAGSNDSQEQPLTIPRQRRRTVAQGLAGILNNTYPPPPTEIALHSLLAALPLGASAHKG